MSGLTNAQQALLMLAAFLLPVLVTWSANGMPSDRTSISLVISGLLAGGIAFMKEISGGTAESTTTAPQTTPTTTTTPAPPATPIITYGAWTKGSDLFTGQAVWFRNVYQNGAQISQQYSTTDPSVKVTPA